MEMFEVIEDDDGSVSPPTRRLWWTSRPGQTNISKIARTHGRRADMLLDNERERGRSRSHGRAVRPLSRRFIREA